MLMYINRIVVSTTIRYANKICILRDNIPILNLQLEIYLALHIHISEKFEIGSQTSLKPLIDWATIFNSKNHLPLDVHKL